MRTGSGAVAAGSRAVAACALISVGRLKREPVSLRGLLGIGAFRRAHGRLAFKVEGAQLDFFQTAGQGYRVKSAFVKGKLFDLCNPFRNDNPRRVSEPLL